MLSIWVHMVPSFCTKNGAPIFWKEMESNKLRKLSNLIFLFNNVYAASDMAGHARTTVCHMIHSILLPCDYILKFDYTWFHVFKKLSAHFLYRKWRAQFLKRKWIHMNIVKFVSRLFPLRRVRTASVITAHSCTTPWYRPKGILLLCYYAVNFRAHMNPTIFQIIELLSFEEMT